MTRQSLGMTIFRNTVYITSGDLLLKVLNFAFRIFVIRSLGDELFGEYSVILAFVGLMQIVAEFGVSQYVMREIARDRSATDRLFGNLVVLRLMLAIVSVVVLAVAAAQVGYSPQIVQGIFFYSLTFIFAAFLAPTEILLTAHERFDYVTLLSVIGQIAFMVLGSAVLFLDLGLTAFIIVGLIAMVPQIIAGFWLVRRHGLLPRPLSRLRVHPSDWPRLMRLGIPFGLITLSLSIAFSIDTIILSWFWPSNEVGWYNAAYQLARSLLFFVSGFSVAIVPSLAGAYVRDKKEVDFWFHRMTRLIFLTGLPIAVGGTVVAEPLIRFLYTDQFLPAARVFQVLVWDVPLLMFASFCGNMTTVVGEERAAARIYMINAGANVILNLIFIPRFGILGAAVITVVTDLLAVVQFHLVLSRKLNLPNVAPLALRVALASTLMGAMVLLVRGWGLFIQIGIGIVMYGALLLLLRIPDDTDWALARRAWVRVRRGSRVQDVEPTAEV